ncbi:ABC-type glycerol-3-phosphate transport system, substrate-binding protein [Carnobacterium alterfunditum]|uniref:ABC-type glycerol-3-phosphate transport system, substrate-binding protein n=1 Tax=Carnobacterium alterfunditum TaxID=28230 RepID=A0A1N6EXI4_9LACT|nr:ABC transporter substrate-binding protein [Carnobacterium alterfunditum]SIN87769.1 ABC-type glycerol-3-phosphate transport system, substrate-binding protein [Carnobacterium alterfunditum]
MKKWVSVLSVAGLGLTLAGCGEDKPDLTITSFTDELQGPIDKFEEINDVTVELQIIPTADYRQTMQPTLESGDGAPDIFTGEIAYMQQWLNADYWTDLSAEPYNVTEWEDEYVDYVYDLGKDEDGNVRAMSWQTTPGGIYYRRSIAKEVLGTDDPKEVGAMMSNMDDLFEVGAKMKEAGYALFPDEGSISKFTSFATGGSDPQPWVNEDNELVVTDERLSYFDYAKTLRDEQYTALAPAWSPSWYESFNGPINYNMGWEELEGEAATAAEAEANSQIEVFSVALPTWALDAVFKQSSNANAGDWAVTNGPSSYFEGGTWLGVYEGSENKDLAFKFVEMMVHDEEFLTERALETGDVLSYKPVTEAIKDDMSDDFLGGQNHYEFFLEEAEKIDANVVTPYDQQLNELFGTQVGAYVEGEISKEEGVQEFYNQVNNAFPDIVTPDEK